jgi:cupin superfamily protein
LPGHQALDTIRSLSTTWLDFDAEAFSAAFGDHPLLLRHRLAGHPKLQLEAIAALAAELPPSWTYPQPGNLPTVLPEGPPRMAADSAEVARTIADNGYRLTLYYLERVDSFRELLHGCLDQVAEVLGDREGGMHHRDASIFLAGPGAVVPVHIDRHHNVVLQVAGSKELTVGAFADPAVQRREIERNFEARQMADELPPALHTFHLGAGDALYLPPYSFHWLKGGPDVTVALSCAFSTPETERTELVHACNARLRSLGVPARPPGSSRQRDRAKAAVMSGARRLRRRAPARQSR